MKSFSTMKRLLSKSTSVVYTLIIALMFSLGLSSAQAKDRISYFHSDISGSPIAATNGDGELLWEETYKPYGERLNDSDSTHKGNNNNWFTGKQEEADLGLQYFGARWYHQASGRFISRDPAAVMDHVESNPMMFNRYAYANNNPYKYVDPDGRVVMFIPLVIFIAKEVASEGIEQVTGLPMPTVKNGLKYAIKQANKQIAREGMKQATKLVKETSKKGAKKTYYSKKKRLEAHKNAEGKCEYCSKPTQTKTPFKSDSAEGDHFIPQAKGGKTTSEQLVNSCRDCNGSGGKGSKMPGSEWKPSNPNQRIKDKMSNL